LSIRFNSTESRFKPKFLRKRRAWILSCAKSENFTIQSIQFIFCSDKYLLEINRNFLKHNFYTDVITFSESSDSVLIGEIYISVERVRENSKIFNVEYNHELNRVLVHGVLHLMNYMDSTKKEKALMTRKENLFLEKF